MKNFKLIFGLFLAFLFLTFTNSLQAQYIIEQIESEIPISYELIPEDIEFEVPEDEINFILKIPESKLKEAALAEGREIREEKITTYIDGKNFAVETESEEMGKTTMISGTKTGVMHYIMWSPKKIIEIKPEDMDKIAEKSNAAIEKMLENMSPEMQKQVRAEMEKEKNKSAVKYDAQLTGNKMKLNGFNCEEYRVNKNEDVTLIWASNDKFGIIKEINRVSNKFDELFKSSEDEGVDEWQLVPGKIPVQVRTYTSSMMMGEPVLFIQSITKIEKKKPSADKFRVPGKKEGFTKGSMMDMMMEIMPSDE
jgi:frataxin-like iron-binding protein CyaY